jgi:hypothetical protein
MAKAEERFREARELYRDAQTELKKWSESHADEIRFLKEELEESLLDLKQAVIELNVDDTERYLAEVRILIADLKSHKED